MTMGTPAGLWILGLIPVLILIHWLRPRPVRAVVTTLFLWEAAAGKRPGRFTLQALFRNLSLLVQILVVGALALALSDLRLKRPAQFPGPTVLVMDISASMQTRSGGTTRFALARKAALDRVADLSPGSRMMIIAAGSRPRVVCPFTPDQTRLSRMIREMAAADAPADIPRALSLALSFAGRDGRILLVGDGGAFSGLPEGVAARVTPVRIRGGERNLAVTRFEARPDPLGDARLELMVEIANFSPGPTICPLTVRAGRHPVLERRIGLEAGERKGIVLQVPDTGEDILTARIAAADDLDVDNQAWVVPARPEKRTVFLVSDGNFFLEQFLKSCPGIRLNTSRGLNPAAWPRIVSQNDVVILDRVAPPSANAGRLLMINALPPDLTVRASGQITAPRITDWKPHSPITRHVDFTGITMDRAMKLKPGPGAVGVAFSGQYPLICRIDRNGFRGIVVGFDIRDSDLPLRVAYPVLMKNMLDWLHPMPAGSRATHVAAGESLALPPGPAAVRFPSNRWEKTESGSVIAEEVGLYKIRAGKTRDGRARALAAVNLVNAAESDIRPVAAPAPAESVASHTGVALPLPLWRFCLAAALVLTLAEAGLRYWRQKTRSALFWAAGCTACAMLGLSDLRLPETRDRMTLMVCQDRTLSVATQDLPWLPALLDGLGARDRAGLVVFGEQAYVEHDPGPVDRIMAPVRSRPGPERTHLEKAILTAAGRLGGASVGAGAGDAAGAGDGPGDAKILLVTDGNQNLGDAGAAAALAGNLGIEIWPVPARTWFDSSSDNDSGERGEVFLEDLTVPGQVDLETPLDIRVRIGATRAGDGEVVLSRDGRILEIKTVDLRPGTHAVTFTDRLGTPGIHRYDVTVNSRQDRIHANNSALGFARSLDAPAILFLSQDPAPPMASALAAQGFEVAVSDPARFPDSRHRLLRYRALVLDNVPATRLTPADQAAVESFVRDAGGGLMVIGGDESFGAGLYRGTPLERALPLWMAPPATLEMPDFCLLLLLDTSASMTGEIVNNTKLEGAKTAAFSAVELLNPFDRIGILGFDTDHQWVATIRPAREKQVIADALSRIAAEGGTRLLPALSHAFETLAATGARKKHVIVLSDGKTEDADFAPLVKAMAEAGISISTVAVGTGADRQLLGKIAAWGNGRAYYTDDADRIPRIFTGDTRLAVRDLLVTGHLPTRPAAGTDLVAGIPLQDLPASDGLVRTTPKPGARLVFTTDKGPLLAACQYGLGRSIAFTSRFDGKWGSQWVNWVHFEALAARMAGWIMKTDAETGIRGNVTRTGDQGRFRLDVLDGDGRFRNDLSLGAKIRYPSGKTVDLPLAQTAPGRYQVDFPAREAGGYYLTPYLKNLPGGRLSGKDLPARTFCLAVPVSGEFKDREVNHNLLEMLARTTGGQVVDPDRALELLLENRRPVTGGGRSTWPWAVAAFALLFCTGIAVEKLSRSAWTGRFWPRQRTPSRT